jgi:hypothetical protein
LVDTRQQMELEAVEAVVDGVEAALHLREPSIDAGFERDELQINCDRSAVP